MFPCNDRIPKRSKAISPSIRYEALKMDYSNIFSNAHATAKATRHFFNSYRGAFSCALSNEMRAAWMKVRLELKRVKTSIKSLSGVFISNVAEKAMNSKFDHFPLFDSKGVYIALRNNKDKPIQL